MKPTLILTPDNKLSGFNTEKLKYLIQGIILNNVIENGLDPNYYTEFEIKEIEAPDNAIMYTIKFEWTKGERITTIRESRPDWGEETINESELYNDSTRFSITSNDTMENLYNELNEVLSYITAEPYFIDD